MPKYEIVDRQTGKVVSKQPYVTLSSARNRVDKLDNDYGAYRYYAREIGTSKVVSY